MAGSSKRRGATRKAGTKKGPVSGSGGQKPKALRGHGPTPPAEMRPGHPAARRAAREQGRSRRRSGQQPGETVLGRNPVLECLRAGVPATALQVAYGTERDDRVREAVRLATDAGVAVVDVPRAELDRNAAGAAHQGLALRIAPYSYGHPDDLLAAARAADAAPLLVACDGMTDPRNLGAVVRSAAAFGAHGVLLPSRRAAGMTAVAWRASAGTAAWLPVARAPNLVRTVRDWATAGLMVAGLDAGGSVALDGFELATGPLVLIVGSEGAGLSRLVRQTCDQAVSIPIAAGVESLNASVAAGVVLAEVARRRAALP